MKSTDGNNNDFMVIQRTWDVVKIFFPSPNFFYFLLFKKKKKVFSTIKLLKNLYLENS